MANQYERFFAGFVYIKLIVGIITGILLRADRYGWAGGTFIVYCLMDWCETAQYAERMKK